MNSELGGREGRQSDAVPSTIVPNAQNDGNNLRNISVQTGEEFSPDFLRDRTTASRMPFVNDVDQSPTTNRPGFNLVCEDVTDLCGLRRKDSESGTDLPDFSPSKVHAFDVDHRTHLNGAHRYYREFQPSLQHQRKFSDDYDKGNPSAPPLYSSDSPNSHQHYNKGLGIPEGSFPRKMKFLCSFGGRILPRPNDGKLRYVGGETKIISIRMSLNYAEFVRKTSAICNQPHTIKYQLPGEDLDALISVSCDEDLHHLIEEYHDLERNSQRLRIFLVTCCDNDSQCSLEDRTVQQSDADYKYVVAVNGMMDPSLHRSSSRESLASQWGAQLDSPTSFQHQEKQDGGSSLNLKLMLKSPTVQGFNVPSKSYIPSPPSSPVWFKDANNAYLKGNEDVVRPDGYDYPSPFFVEAPTYENPYRVDVKSYYHNPPIDSMPIIGSPNQKNYLFESHAVANMRSHFRKPSKEFESCSPSGANISNGRRSLLNAVPLHSKNEFVSPDTVSFSPTSDNHDKVHNREINMLSESQPQYEQFLEGREVSFSTFFGEKSPSLALSTSSQEREAQQPIADEKYQASKSKVELSQETPDLKKDYTEWGQDTIKRGEMKETFLDQDVKTDACYNNYATNTNFQEHKPNLQKIICQPDSDLRIHVPTSKQQVDGGKYSASSSDSILNQSEVWRELPRNYQLSTNVPEFLIKSQQETINKNSHIPNEINCNSFLSEYHGLHHVGYKGNDDQSRISPFLFRDDESSFGDLSDPLVTGKISGNLGREVSGYKVLVDDSQRSTVKGSHDSGNMENIKNKSINLNVGNDTFIYSKYSDNNHKDGIPEMPVIIQDVTNDMLADVPSSSKAIPLVEEEASDGVIFPDEETEAGSSIPEFDSDDVKVDEDDKDESISDAAIIEMEAGIYGLQIIRNADLEDLHELGSGTFGTVYHGKWRGTDVAIKRIKKSCFAGRASEQERLTKDFWREAQILSKLHHPNVVAFYGVVPDGPGGTLATVTEYMANGSLRHVLLRKDRALDRRKKVIIALDAAFGMEYLHLKNIVHFDLKCDNLLVNLGDLQRPVCKVGDFGLSRIKRNTLVSGGVRGTLPWMAPELLSGISVRVSEKVDVYSFGIAMWEIITGEEPFANMHCGAIIGGIVNNTLRPPVPERCDLEWRKLMEECWSHDPAMRPSFTEITNRLRVMSAALQPKRVNRVKR